LHASDAKAVVVLRFKGYHLCRRRKTLYIAILLHDIGHGPFRTLWKKVLLKMYITRKFLLFMHQLNTEFNGQLDLSIQSLKGLSSSIYVATHF
jgi:HD superfamily phosphohydrolase